MQLPKELQHFSEPTLILLADHTSTKFWLAGGDALEEIDALALPRERKSDHESSFVNVDTSAGSGPEPKIEEERLHRFAKSVSERLAKLVQDHHVTQLYLVSDGEFLSAVKKSFPKNLLSKIKKELRVELMKEHILDVVRRLFRV